jgi:hypothetical protein
VGAGEASVGTSVGSKVGMLVGAIVVGIDVGTVVGVKVGAIEATVGDAVGLAVAKHDLSSSAFTTKPSKHWHMQVAPSATAFVVVRSHPGLSSQGCSVGMCVGCAVGRIVGS